MAIITKGALINGAYALMRISGLTVDPSPENIEVGLQVADDYAAELKPMIDLNWQQPSDYGLSDPADNSGLSVSMAGPFKKLLVLELCGYFGKEIPGSVMATAAAGMRHLEQLLITVPLASNPSTLPFGSGNEDNYLDQRFYRASPDNTGARYVMADDVLNFSVDFTQDPNWLLDDVLDTVTWEADSGIALASESNTDTVATAELTFNYSGTVAITGTKVGSTDTLTVLQNFVVNRRAGNGLSFV